MQFRCSATSATHAAAGALATAIGDEGLLLALVGPLGAGKTAFVKGLADGLGVDPALVSSPTFVIVNHYPAACGDPDGPAPAGLAHVDLYRLESEAELEDVGFRDLLGPGAVVAVEWADRLPEALPDDRLEVRIERPADATRAESRSFTVSATRKGSRAVLEAWEHALRQQADAQLEIL